MTLMFDRDKFFDSVRVSLFNNKMTQQQVDGMNFKLAAWEANPRSADLRFIGYPFATSYHETAKTMWPIEEIGKGSGHPYGKKDAETGQTYYGRGDVQLTWRDNYRKATLELGLVGGTDDLEWHAARALDPTISAEVMYSGMMEGWFTGKKMPDFFSDTKNDPVNARGIINNDVSKMGQTIAGYHNKFVAALTASYIAPVTTDDVHVYTVTVTVPAGTPIKVTVEEVS